MSTFSVFLIKIADKTDTQSPGPEVIKLFAYSIQLSIKFIMLINVKISTMDTTTKLTPNLRQYSV